MNKAAAIFLGSLTLIVAGCTNKVSDSELVLQGNVDLRQVSLAFLESGRVAEMKVEEGDTIAAGTVLATLDTRSLRLQAERANADVAMQQQNVERLLNGSRPEEVEQARARLAAARADEAKVAADYARMRAISSDTGGRGVSAQDVDHARKAAESAGARTRELAASLRLVEAGPRAEDKRAAQAQLRSAKAQSDLFAYNLDQSVLRAPVGGVVRSRLIEVGDMVSPQKPAFAIALNDPKWVRVYVNEPDLGRIREGLTARIYTDSQPDKPVRGQIGYISAVAEFTPKAVQTEELRTNLVYEVRVMVSDRANQLRLGQPVTVRIDLAGAKAAGAK